MIKMALTELASILDAEESAYNTVDFTGISKDTRTLQPGNLYVAILGEDLNGHDFIDQAMQKGAAAVLVSQAVDPIIPNVLVPDTIKALGTIGENWRDRFKLPIIGVTGSNGKTTTKNMIASILQAAAQPEGVLATQGNLNNAIGLPLMLTRINTKNRYGVIEMGMNSFGEIDYLTRMTKPIVTVITNAAESHLQGLKDTAGVAKAKGEIFNGLSTDGIAILNTDSPFFDYWKGLVASHRIISFGMQNPADISVMIHEHTTGTKQHLTIKTPIGKVDVQLPLLGKHNVINALAATAATIAIGLDLDVIKAGLENIKAAPGRMLEVMLPNGTRIIDDTYNANPFSTNAAIQALSNFKGKRVLVLADMRELGPDAEEMHALTGKRALDAGIDYLFTLGELSAASSKSFGTNAQHFTDKDKLVAALQTHLQEGSTILVKGSRSMHMENVVAKLVPANLLTPIY